MMNRRQLIAASLTPASAWLLSPGAAHAHHGWSSFDQDRPLYLEGRAAKVAWRNPHAELELEVGPQKRVHLFPGVTPCPSRWVQLARGSTSRAGWCACLLAGPSSWR